MGITVQTALVGGLASSLLLLSACATPRKAFSPDKKAPEVYALSFRQHAPEPVYSRLRWVHLPEVLPSKDLPGPRAPLMKPVMHVEFKNTRLEEVSAALAKATNYASYCASSVAERRVSVNMLGTVDEVVRSLEQQADVQAIVDHENRQIRVLARALPAAEDLAGEETDAPQKIEPQFPSDDFSNPGQEA